ncbi:MAG: hypothetical protein L0Y75_05430 [Acidobacteria bacterium]|nr:hypothetical protein [Acidobacteriota bacterium]
MTWDEFQDQHLEIAREVGAEHNLRAELIDPEELRPEPFNAKPLAVTLWSLFRRPKLREIAVAFYRPDDQTQPYSIIGNWVDLNDLGKLNASAYRRDLEVSIREILEEAKNTR